MAIYNVISTYKFLKTTIKIIIKVIPGYPSLFKSPMDDNESPNWDSGFPFSFTGIVSSDIPFKKYQIVKDLF